MNLTTKTVRGISWTGISQVFRILLQLAITALLARMLTPNEFGLLAMVVVFTNFAMVFSDFGFSAALIQRKKLTEKHLSSIFWINVFTGLILALLLIILAPLISNFYTQDKLTLIIAVLSSTFLISSFGIVQSALLIKDLNFKSLAIIEIASSLISGIIAVAMAFSGFGVWSLVWPQVISSFLTVTLLWKFSIWKPKLIFNWREVKELLNFGLNLTGFGFVNYFNRNFDNLLIGKFLGSAYLGYYNLAYQLLLIPLSNISQVIGRVMFPSLSTIQDDKEMFCSVYIKAVRYIAVITFPLMIGVLVVAPQFIRLLFGPQWERSIFLVQIFAIVGLFQSIATTVGWIFQSQGRTDIQFRWGLISTAVVILFFVIGIRWGVEGVTIAYSVATFLLLLPLFTITFKLIDLKLSFFVKQFKTIFVSAIGMGTIVFMLRHYMETSKFGNDFIILVSSILIGAISYVGFLYLFDKNLYKEIFHLVKHLKSPTLIKEQILV